jgi:hypothetical protein
MIRKLWLGLVLVLLMHSAAAAGDKENALLDAVRKSDVTAVKTLLAQGADANAKFRYDRSILSFACDRGNLEIVRMLLDSGAEVNSEDSFYKATPLDWASNKNHVEIAKLLLEKGAKGREGTLAEAARSGKLDMLKMVLELGGLKAEVLTDALGAAESAKQTEAAEVLKAAGAVPPKKPDFQVDAATLAKYVGTYRSSTPNAPELRWALKDGKLVGGVPTQSPPITLGAFDPVSFTVIEFQGIYITFKVEGGKCTGLHLKQRGFEADYTRVEEKQ